MDGFLPLLQGPLELRADVVRVVHHEVNRGYGGALRSGFEASRYDLLCFTDGDRQFRIADLTNPILQPWTRERLRHVNERVASGEVTRSFWPAISSAG